VGIARELKLDYEVTVISPGAESTYEYQGIRFINRGRQSRLLNLVGNLEFWRYALDFILKCDFDAIIVHSAATPFLALVSDILPARCCGVIHDTHPGKHGYLFDFWRDLWLRRSRGLDLVFTDNLADRERLLKRYRLSARKVYYAGVGTDPLGYQFSADKGDQLVFIGRFVRSKNIAPLIEALRPLLLGDHKSKLVLVGSGVLRGEIENRVSQNGLGRQVELRSGLSDREKIAELQRSKLYVSLSEVEGFGMSVVEAMACGAVPVVSDIPAHRFIFQEKNVGFLVKDAAELASRAALLLKEEATRREMANRARALVEDAWSWSRIKEKYDRAMATLPEKNLSPLARRLKRPLKIGILRLLIALFYALLVRFTLLKSRNDGK
jgi:glycosyltransferase involved in cell wall biosynthesis